MYVYAAFSNFAGRQDTSLRRLCFVSSSLRTGWLDVDGLLSCWEYCTALIQYTFISLAYCMAKRTGLDRSGGLLDLMNDSHIPLHTFLEADISLYIHSYPISVWRVCLL
jgi:hypothetical protein